MKNFKREWDNSYAKRDNFLFYPHEEVIRFVSKYIRKRIGLAEFENISFASPPPKILDVGCGIGRHLLYCEDMGLNAYGIDLSDTAISIARSWLNNKGIQNTEQKIIQADVSAIPFDDNSFDYALSHGVLDSMEFNTAKACIRELYRILVSGGLFYCDIISGDDQSHAREYCGEVIVNGHHEYGTVQSYFNFAKLQDLFQGLFTINECLLIRREDVTSGCYSSRYHIVLAKKLN